MSLFKRLWGKSAKAAGAPAEQSKEAAPERRRQKRHNAKPGLSVLIIDDSPTILAALGKILRSAGYVTTVALNAEEGLEKVKEARPDLIFLDILLPGMNGFAALRLLRKEEDTRELPVIMISGNEHAAEQFYSNRIGADDFMKKPFSRFEVFSRIENLLDATQVPRRKVTPEKEKARTAKAAVAAPLAPIVPLAVVSPALVTAPTTTHDPIAVMSALEARKELAAMGLKYFSQEEFNAAVKRSDQLAVKLFIRGGGINHTLSTASA